MRRSDWMKSAEWLSATLVAAWGLVLIMPGDSFLWSNGYAPFLNFAPEEQWGVVALSIGLFHMVALRAHRCAFGREGRMIALIHNGLWWGLIGGIRFVQDPHAPNWLTASIMMITMGISLIHLIREKPELAHESPSQHRSPEPHQA